MNRRISLSAILPYVLDLPPNILTEGCSFPCHFPFISGIFQRLRLNFRIFFSFFRDISFKILTLIILVHGFMSQLKWKYTSFGKSQFWVGKSSSLKEIFIVQFIGLNWNVEEQPQSETLFF